MNFKLFLRIFFILCLIFGLINLAIGGAAIYGYYKLQGLISTTSSQLNQSLSSVKTLFSNVTRLTANGTSEIGLASHNATFFLSELESNLSVSKQDFYNESNYFSTFILPDSSQQQSQGVSAAFKNLGNQLNTIQNQYLPMLQALVQSETAKVNGSVSGINSSISRLNQSVYLMADSISSEIGIVGSLVSLALLGFAFYSILEGIIFVMLGLFIHYLINTLYGAKNAVASDKVNDLAAAGKAESQRAKRTSKAVGSTSNDGEPKGKERKGGLLNRIRDSFGIEE
jgi:hypothetical protein